MSSVVRQHPLVLQYLSKAVLTIGTVVKDFKCQWYYKFSIRIIKTSIGTTIMINILLVVWFLAAPCFVHIQKLG